MNSNSVFFTKRKNGRLEVDIAGIPGWDGFDELIKFVKKYYHAIVIEKIDGRDARVCILESEGIVFELIHDDVRGNWFLSPSAESEALVYEIAKTLEVRLENVNSGKFVEELLKKIPKFVSKMEPDDLLPYMVFGDFGRYIRDMIDDSNYDMNEINAIFDFLNKMGESDDDQIQNLLTVGALEILIDSKKVMEIARKHLKGQALSNLELIEEFWYGNNR